MAHIWTSTDRTEGIEKGEATCPNIYPLSFDQTMHEFHISIAQFYLETFSNHVEVLSTSTQERDFWHSINLFLDELIIIMRRDQ